MKGKKAIVLGALVFGLIAAVAGGNSAWRRWGWWRFMKPEVMTSRGESGGVSMSCQLEISEGSLTVFADARNAGADDVYLLDFGKGSAEFVLGYLDGGTLHLVTGVAPMPHFPTTWLFHPDETKLRPGESKSLVAAIQFPIHEGGVYYGTRDPISGPVSFSAPLEIRRVVYELDLLHSADPEFTPDPPRGPIERVTCAFDLAQPIPVQSRSDEGFETQRKGRHKYPFKVRK